MPGTVYPPALINDRGVAPATIAPAATLEIANSGLMWLRITGVTGAATLTIHNQTTEDGNPGPDLVINSAAGATVIAGPFPRGFYNNAKGNIEVAINTPANIAALEAYALPGAA